MAYGFAVCSLFSFLKYFKIITIVFSWSNVGYFCKPVHQNQFSEYLNESKDILKLAQSKHSCMVMEDRLTSISWKNYKLRKRKLEVKKNPYLVQ